MATTNDSHHRAHPPSRVRRWMLNIHLYGGLFVSWYFLALGISVLGFNHPWLIPAWPGGKHTWEHRAAFPAGAGNVKLTEAVRDELGLAGWVPPWNMKRDVRGDLHFEIVRPGKRYAVATDRAAGTVRVEAQSTGIRSIMGFLHCSTGAVPGSRFLRLWGGYSEITVWTTLFLVASGIYLWARRQKELRSAFIAVAGGCVLAGAFMACLYFIG
ncbi:hypothetical protein GX586_10670 [bacterium]|nr:hypothetical protein [bacterium]